MEVGNLTSALGEAMGSQDKAPRKRQKVAPRKVAASGT
jgi:hypothetical protein